MNISLGAAIIFLFLSGLGACTFISQTANQTATKLSPTFLPTVLSTINITAPKSPLSDFPLNLGNTWVYSATYYATYNGQRNDGTAYIEVITATYRITETVADVQLYPPYFAAQLVQEQVVVTSSIDLNELDWKGWDERYLNGRDKTRIYWYVISDMQVYKQDILDLSKVETSWLEYIFPLSESVAWYPDQEQREMFPDVKTGPSSGLREASGPITLSLPGGNFDECFDVLTHYLGGGTRNWFCVGVGVAGSEFDHQGTPYGNKTVLIEYSLK